MDSNPQIDQSGTKRWYDAYRRLHREGGPAVIRLDGYKAWYQNGYVHRFGGPAIIHPNGDKIWRFYGIDPDVLRFATATQETVPLINVNWKRYGF